MKLWKWQQLKTLKSGAKNLGWIVFLGGLVFGMSLPDVTLAQTKPKSESSEEDLKKVDDEITNARMRADLGAAKRWSFNSSLSYNGSTLARPADPLRPNIRRGSTVPDASTSLSGTVGVVHRIDKNNAFNLSTGVNIFTPFAGDWTRTHIKNPTYQGKPGQRREVQRINVADPSLGYNHNRRIGDIQSITSMSIGAVTNPITQQQLGMLGSFTIQQTLATQQDKWTFGFYLTGATYFYEGSLNAQQRANETLFSAWITPFMEYQFTDLIGWRAVFNYFAWDYLKNAPKNEAYSFFTPQNSTGVMFSVSRDVWLYPNVQFLPFNLRSDLTNWGVSTIINL